MEKQCFNIVIAHPQPIVLAGLIFFLSERNDFKLEGIGSFGQLLNRAVVHQPDLLILDYSAPEFISLDDLGRLFNESKNINVLIVSADENKNSILSAYQMGIRGFITQNCSKDELLVAVQSTARGDKFFSSKILDIILELADADKRNMLSTNDDHSGVLTVRETEILRFLAQGQSTQKIADSLYLSPHTVQTHRKSIIRKLKIKSPTQFVIHAMDLGLIKPTLELKST